MESVFSTSQVFDLHNVPEIPLSVASRLCGLDFRSLRCTLQYLTKLDCLAPARMRQEVMIDREIAWETASVSAVSQEEFGQRERSWISCFSIAVIKRHAQGKRKKGFIWAYGFTGIRVYHGRQWEAWCQEQKSENSPLELQAWSRENELEMAQVSKLSKPASSNIFSSSKPCLLNLSTQHHQLGTKCSNAQDYGEGLLFKSP